MKLDKVSMMQYASYMKQHRHKWIVIRQVPNTGDPFVKECGTCGMTLRFHRGRWIVTKNGKEVK